MFEYDCRIVGEEDSTGKRRVKLGDLRALAGNTLEFLKAAVERTYPRQQQPAGEVGQEEQGKILLHV